MNSRGPICYIAGLLISTLDLVTCGALPGEITITVVAQFAPYNTRLLDASGETGLTPARPKQQSSEYG